MFTKFLMPYIILPFDSTRTDPEEIRDYLLEYRITFCMK